MRLRKLAPPGGVRMPIPSDFPPECAHLIGRESDAQLEGWHLEMRCRWVLYGLATGIYRADEAPVRWEGLF